MLEYTSHVMILIGMSSMAPTWVYNCVYDTPEIPPSNPHSEISFPEEVELWDGNISSISKDSLPPGILVFKLSRHPLTNISDDAFDNLARRLLFLQIQEAQFKQLPKALRKLTELRELIITDTLLENWDDDILEKLGTKLLYLTLVNVGLSAWPSWISKFHTVRELNLSRNQLTSVPDNAFSSMKVPLQALHLAFTGLTQVPRSLWTLSRLYSLDLSGNNFVDINEIEKLALDPFDTNLEYLHLTSIGMTRPFFSNFTSLIHLTLDNNNISYYAEGSFLAVLYHVSLSGNHLSAVPSAVATAYKLSFVNLSINEIAEIEADTFPKATETLDLSFNKLTVFKNTTFAKLIILETLYLNNNPITTMGTSAFANFERLAFLFLDSTSLREFPLAVANIATDLRKITLTSNNLSCNCPKAAELNNWYNKAGRLSLSGTCTDGRDISEYFLTKCHLQTTPATTGHALPYNITSLAGHAHALKFNLFCRSGTLLLVIARVFHGYQVICCQILAP